jgi:hypothetical protein
MTLRKLISVASLLAALSIAGCGDEVCDNCEISNQRDLCKDFLRDCTAGDCEARALLLCADPI